MTRPQLLVGAEDMPSPQPWHVDGNAVWEWVGRRDVGTGRQQAKRSPWIPRAPLPIHQEHPTTLEPAFPLSQMETHSTVHTPLGSVTFPAACLMLAGLLGLSLTRGGGDPRHLL